MSLSILGIGTSVPDISADRRQLAETVKQFLWDADTDWLAKLYESSTVEKRGSVLLSSTQNGDLQQTFYTPATGPECRGPSTGVRMKRYADNAIPLAVDACHKALFDSDTQATEITHLITVTCTGFFSPGIDFALINNLGLSRSVKRVQVGFMGCHAVLNALAVARDIARADPNARILLCAVELCSLHYSYEDDPSKMVANSLFADGSAALVGQNVQNADGRWLVKETGSYLIPDSDGAMSWTIGDHGFEMTLEPSVPEMIQSQLSDWLEQWLADCELTVKQIESWAIHPGGPKIISSVAMALGITWDATTVSRGVLSQHGNMSSATILFVIKQLQKIDAPRPCVALAFGPGLVVEAALFE